MKKIILLGAFSFLYSLNALSFTDSIPLPNERQARWQEAELGVLISYDLHIFDGKRYNQQLNRLTPIEDPQIFNPSKLDVEQWVVSAKAAGARFALLTATHETGFALYPSDVNPYSTKILTFKDGKADLVGDFVKACRKHGVLPGIYIGLRWNSLLGVFDFHVNGTGEFRERRQRYYNQLAEGMVKELCTRYGDWFEIWFDGGAGDPAEGTPNVLPIVQKYQPNALFYWNAQVSEARWGGSESGTIGYPNWSTFPYPTMWAKHYPKILEKDFWLPKHGDSTGKYFLPAMADAPLRGYKGRHEWFWEPGDEAFIYPVSSLVSMYEKSVGRNSTLILGLTPDTAGLIPAPDVDTLRAFGAQIRKRYGQALDGQSFSKGSTHMLELSKKDSIGRIVLQEDIRQGHRIMEFRLEAEVKGKWIPIFNGSSIGHKLIVACPPELYSNRIRLRVIKALAPPALKMQAYR